MDLLEEHSLSDGPQLDACIAPTSNGKSSRPKSPDPTPQESSGTGFGTAVRGFEPPSPWDVLLDEALKAGVSALDYWAMTPREVFGAIRAFNWRMKYTHHERAWQAWHTAALMRTRQMPSLQRLTSPPVTRKLSKKEAEDCKAFHEKAVAALPERLRASVS